MPSNLALGKALVRDLKRGGIKTARGDWLTRGAAGGVYRDAAGRRALARGTPLADVERAGELARKKLVPGYAAAKRAVSIANKGELKKYFDAAFLYRLQRLAQRIDRLVALSRK